MKAVLMSIKPKWCELIANGKKTVEVRKTKPKLETPFKVYIYCTKPKKQLWLNGFQGYSDMLFRDSQTTEVEYGFAMQMDGQLNGKIIGEFLCEKVDRIAHCGTCNNDIRLKIVDENLYCQELDYAYLSKCQLPYSDIDKYSNGCDVYGWHISDLVIYDKPKELSEFYRLGKPLICDGRRCETCGHLKYMQVNSDEWDYDCDCHHQLENHITVTKPPQSWCYVEE